MQNFLRETHAYKTVNIDDNQTSQNWTFVTLSVVVSALFILVIVWLIARKTNCHLTQIIGKRLANRYELKRVNVKQTPSNGEDVEMSALIEDRSVSNTSERQQKSFRQTDTSTNATLAWMHGQGQHA